MRPSDFAKINPMSSVFQNSEHETIARNIMVILKRTGDEFRDLPYREYEQHRQNDGNYSSGEKKYFNEVIKFCKNADTARCFSKSWDF